MSADPRPHSKVKLASIRVRPIGGQWGRWTWKRGAMAVTGIVATCLAFASSPVKADGFQDPFIASTPASGSTYRAGENIKVRIRPDNRTCLTTVTGTVTIGLRVGSSTKTLTLSVQRDTWSFRQYDHEIRGDRTIWRTNASVLEGTYRVVAADRDTDGVSIAANSLSGGSIGAEIGNNCWGIFSNPSNTANVSKAHGALTNQSGHKVDGRSYVDLKLGNTSVTEGSNTTVEAILVGGTASSGIVVTVAAAAGNNASAGDFSLSGSTLTIASGDSLSGQVRLNATQNTKDEPDKQVTVSGTTTATGINTTISPVTLTIQDDDALPTATLNLSSSSISENGGSTTVTASLSHPSSEQTRITVAATPVSPAVAGDITVSNNKVLTIAAGSTTSTGTVTITANNNHDRGATKSVTVAGTASGGRGVVSPTSKTLMIPDDDTPAISTGTVSNMGRVTEASGSGRTATFTVALASRPTANVTLAVSSGNTAEGTVSPSSMTFTNSNWNSTQTVTVTGVDELYDDGDQTYNITLDPSSTDTDYNGLSNKEVAMTTVDNDTAGLTTGAVTGQPTEAGGAARFSVRLNSAPRGRVTVSVSSGDTTEGTVSPAILRFAEERTTTGGGGNRIVWNKWNNAQTVTVTGQNDHLDDGDQNYDITLSTDATGGEPRYSRFHANPITATVGVSTTDDDTTGLTVTELASATDPRETTTEAGGTAQFKVALSSEPSANVTVAVSSGDTTEGTVNPASLTFTAANWNSAQEVTVTGQNDAVDDGDQDYVITLNPDSAAGAAGDANYRGLANVTYTFRNTDDDTAGLTVTEAANPEWTTEWGTTGKFKVALSSQPTANVTVAVSSSNTGEGTPSPTSLTFTASNWNSAQEVTVTGQDDEIDDQDQNYVITLNPDSAAGAAGDAKYRAVSNSTVNFRNQDDDASGLRVRELASSTNPRETTTEGGGTAKFKVRLSSEPTADVTVTVSSSDTGEGEITSPSSKVLTFTSSNWNTQQEVTVTGQDDDIDDGDQDYVITLDTASTGDSRYNTFVADITYTFRNTDDDTAGLTVTELAQATSPRETTTEAGGTAQFKVALSTEPTANVTVALSSDDTGEGEITSPSGKTLTFTSSNWNSAQEVTVTGQNDAVDDGDQTYDITLNPDSAAGAAGDAKYRALSDTTYTFRNTDNDTAGVTAGAVSGQATEAGGTATFTVQLDSEPVGQVSVAVSSGDTGEGTVSPTVVHFSATGTILRVSNNLGNLVNRRFYAWNSPRTVTVTGVNDHVDDGDQNYDITLDAQSSNDSTYNSVSDVNVGVSTTDDDTTGLTVTELASATDPRETTTEAGGTAKFKVALASEPTANVTVAVSSNKTGEGTVNPASLTFTSGNWNSTQEVTVTGQNDHIDDGDQDYVITLNPDSAAGAGGDANYRGASNVTYTFRNTDNDTAALVTSSVTGTAKESNTAQTATFTVKLATQPTANVTVAASSADSGEGTPSPTSLTFTASNWNSTQTVTVTGVDDAIQDGTQSYNIELDPSSSGDTVYNGLATKTVGVMTEDDTDTAGIMTSSVTGTAKESSSTQTATFTVKLTSEPTANVTIAVSSADTGEGTPSPTSLTFTSGNWNSTQTVTVTAVDDAIQDGTQSYNIELDPSSATDTVYNNLATKTVGVMTQDDTDMAGLTVTELASATDPRETTTEGGGTAQFKVALSSEPIANVTVTLSSNKTGEGEITSPSSKVLTFTSSNWNSAQDVTVTGQDDDVDDDDQSYVITLNPDSAAGAGGDANYRSLSNVTYTFRNTDDDTVGLTVTELASASDPRETTSENGDTAQFKVALATQPTANVTVTLSSGDTGEGDITSPSSKVLTFTAGNWNSAQTVTVTGQNDHIDDDDQDYVITLDPDSAAGAGGDAKYRSASSVMYTFRNTDNNMVGLAVTELASSSDPRETTTEAGGTAKFKVALASEPTANVTVAVSSGDTGEGTVSPASLTFTSSNWNSTQEVTATGQDDLIDDGDQNYVITLNPDSAAGAGGDAKYRSASNVTYTFRNTDDDTAAIVTSSVTGMAKEGNTAQTATFTVKLATEPTANVTVGVSSADSGEGTPSPTSLTFTASNWNSTQTVTVTAVDDAIEDDTQSYNIELDPSSTGDTVYNGLATKTVEVMTEDDNDMAGMTVTELASATDPRETTTEGGGTAQFKVALTSEPTANVTVTLSSADTGEGDITSPSGKVLTFTAGNWNSAQEVTVTGQDDAVDDDDQNYVITLNPDSAAGAGGDAKYRALGNLTYTFRNTDNDTAALTVTELAQATSPRETTTEGGGTAQFKVALATEPTANVTVTLSSDDTGEGEITTPSSKVLTFTSGNWNSAQEVTVTGQNDPVDDDDQDYMITLNPASTAGDAKYHALTSVMYTFRNTDDDTVGLTVTELASASDPRETTTEGGGTAQFKVALTTRPIANVTVTLSSGDTTEGEITSPSSKVLTFTAGNWNSAQTVTVTGQNDHVDDDDQDYVITLDPDSAAGAGGDGKYRGASSVMYTFRNTDNNMVGLAVTELASATDPRETTTEAGGTAKFKVALASEPTANVTVAVSSGDTGEGTVSPASLTFTSSNWNSAQEVTATGQDDLIDDGDQDYVITLNPDSAAGAGGDAKYRSAANVEYTFRNTDDDTAAIVTSNVTGTAKESNTAQTATFTVKLATEPTANITVGVSSADSGEGTPSPTSLTFTASNWNSTQTVTVTGVDDPIEDGTQTYNIELNPSSTGDTVYNNLATKNVAVMTEDDNDMVGLRVTELASATDPRETTTEGGGTAQFKVELGSQPTANVTVTLSSADTGEGDITSPSSKVLTFTANNWNSAQEVTVTGQDDLIDDDDQNYVITLNPDSAAGAGGDALYRALSNVTYTFRNTDDDTAALTVTELASSTNPRETTTEGGGTAQFKVALATEPTANVTVRVLSTDTGEGTPSPSSLTFTSSNWNSAQEVTVTGQDDYEDRGDEDYSIVLSVASTTGDAKYRGGDVSGHVYVFRNTDDDTAGVVPSSVTGTASEDGTTSKATFTVKLASRPILAVVTVAVSSADTTEGTPSPTSLTFGLNNWNNAQTVTVTGVDDPATDGDQTYNIVLDPSTIDTLDTYHTAPNATVAVTTVDDDVPGLRTGTVSGTITEAGGAATFTVRLNTLPSGDVTVAVSSGDSGEGTVSPSSMTFTINNWNSTQTVTVTGANDSIDDGDQNYDIILDPASTADSDYNGLDNVDVRVTTTDDDTAGITLSDLGAGTPRETVTEATGAGRTATFDVELDSEPTANVVIALSSTDTTEGTVSPASLTFTATNWNSTQTVTLTGVDDFIDDGDRDYAVRLASPTGSDSVYSGLSQQDVLVRTLDNDTKGVTVTPTALKVAEGGAGQTYTLVLNTQPEADVTITIASSDTAVTPSVSSVTFGTGNWNSAVTVTVTAATDNDDYAKGGVKINHTVSGTGSGYENVNAATVIVTVRGGSADRRIAMHSQGTTNYEVNNQTVTVTVSEGVNEAIEVAPPAALGQDLAITLSRVSSSVPLTGGAYTLGGDTVFDIDVDVVPTGGLEICLPYNADLETASTGRPLLLLHYDESSGEWETVSGATLRSTATGTLVCATVTEFSVFGVGFVDVPDQLYTVNTPITTLILPELVDGDVDYILSPALPVGLSLNAGTRTVSGTPTEEQTESLYTWRVMGGTAVLTFAITVENSRDKERARLRRLNESVVPELARALTDSVSRAIRERLEGAKNTPTSLATSFGSLIQGNARALEDGTFKWRKALSGRHFALPLNAADESRNLTLWGAGDWRDLSLKKGPLDWDGDAFSWHLGIDTEWGTNKTAGVTVSWFESDIDYGDKSEGAAIKGDHESEMVSIHPYIGWSGEDGRHLWATAGYGEGEITIDDEDLDEKQRSDSTLKTLSAGGSMRVYERDDLKIAIRGEGQTTRWRIDDNGDRIDGVTIDAHRLRLAAEGSRRQVLETGAILTSSLELGVRYDGGDGETGHGVEIGGNFDYSDGGVRIRTHGRYLVAHESDLDEWGIGGALELIPAANGRGLRLSLSPTWGTTGSGIGELWERGLALKEDSEDDAELKLETEMGYGLYRVRGLLTPYLGLSVLEEGRHYRIGSEYQFNEAFSLKLEGERREHDDEDTEHGIGVQAVIRW